jgi:hypothetical protein
MNRDSKTQLPEYVNGLPNICGAEKLVADAVRDGLKKTVQLPSVSGEMKMG